MTDDHRIASLDFDDSTVSRRAPHLEQQRRVAMADILRENYFRPIGDVQGPYDLRLGMQESRLAIEVRNGERRRLGMVLLSLTPLRRVVRDYLAVCETYHEALSTASPSLIEAIDVGRRSLHGTRRLVGGPRTAVSYAPCSP